MPAQQFEQIEIKTRPQFRRTIVLQRQLEKDLFKGCLAFLVWLVSPNVTDEATFKEEAQLVGGACPKRMLDEVVDQEGPLLAEVRWVELQEPHQGSWV